MPLPGLEVEPYQPATFPKTETLFSTTRQVVFFRDVWQYEFGFLGLRQLKIEATGPDGGDRVKNIWYLAYRVRNTGVAVSHDKVPDPRFGHVDHVINTAPGELDPNTLPGRFFPVFTLSGWVQDAATGTYQLVEYKDRVLPGVKELVAREEDPDETYLDTVQMVRQVLERFPADSGQGGTWGLAVWYNVDPAIDFVTVKVNGLTNAFRLERNPDGELDVIAKTLQLNFWRPGDRIDEDEDVVDYGIPLLDNSLDQSEIARRYRLPGPVIRGLHINPENLRKSVVFETDAELSPRNFESAVGAQLDAAQIAENVLEGFTGAGVTLGGDAAITTNIPGRSWTIKDTWENAPRQFLIELYPEFWEKTIDGGIRFIKRIDHLWVYE